jgi:hypothetical protein
MANFSLETLTEGIRARHVGTQNKALVEKWSRFGLLRGLDGVKRENMARMLENQASQLLKEVSSVSSGAGTSSGDLRGFTNIAFPIVRRVFGGLIANDLVSIQPMSLPSGLLFYLDYTYGGALAGNAGSAAPYTSGSSIYNSPAGKGIRSGSLAVGGHYDLAGSGYSRQYGVTAAVTLSVSGAFGGTTTFANSRVLVTTGTDGRLLQFDPQITTAIEGNSQGPGASAGSAVYSAVIVSLESGATKFGNADLSLVKDFSIPAVGPYKVVANDASGKAIQGGEVANVRRLNQLGLWDGVQFVPNALVSAGDSGAALLLIVSGANAVGTAPGSMLVTKPLASSLDVGTSGDTLVIPSFESDFGTTPSPAIPEIDIKVESVAVVAETR